MLFWIWIPGTAWAYGGRVLVESGFPTIDRKVHHFRRWMCYDSKLLNQLHANSTQEEKTQQAPMPGMRAHRHENGHHLQRKTAMALYTLRAHLHQPEHG